MDDNRQQMIAQIKALKELQRRRATETVNPATGGGTQGGGNNGGGEGMI